MTETTKFSVIKVDDANVTILADGVQTDVTISALVLEYQYQLENCWYLLFLSYDCPWEEELTIALLDDKFYLLDKIKLGGMFSTGALMNVVFTDQFSLTFLFTGRDPHTLKIEKNGFFFSDAPNLTGRRSIWRFLTRKYLHVTSPKMALCS